MGVPSNLIWVLGDFDKIFRIDDFVRVQGNLGDKITEISVVYRDLIF